MKKSKKNKPIDDLSEELTDDMTQFANEEIKSIKKGKTHYINNAEFFKAMVVWKEAIASAIKNEEKKPPVSDYIGKCFLDIANHLSYRPNFINYAYRDDMIGDGIENCLMYASNFDPTKSKNPFSYFTQIIYFAFLRRIYREKKQMFIRYKMIEATDENGDFKHNLITKTSSESIRSSDDPVAAMLKLTPTDISNFSKISSVSKTGKKTGKKISKKTNNKLDNI